MKKVASLLNGRFEKIITYLTHPITNATSESINAKIQWVKYTARGFRGKQNFINAIYFHCGGLDLAQAHRDLTPRMPGPHSFLDHDRLGGEATRFPTLL
jgi:transposase